MITIGSLFSGIGGFEIGLERAIANSKTVFQVEQNSYRRKILAQNWNCPIFEDVKEVGAHNLPKVDIICGGFPCQDVSILGRGEGLKGLKSGLWYEMYRIICEMEPRIAILENSAALSIRGLDTILGQFAEIGYDALWISLRAHDFGLPHRRERLFLVAYSNKNGNRSQNEICARWKKHNKILHRKQSYWRGRIAKSRISRRDHGISNRVDRIKAIGDAIPPVYSEFIGKKIIELGLLKQSKNIK